MSLVVDTQDKICLYHTKQQEKAGRIFLENLNKNYKFSYFNKILLGYTEEFLIFSCHKDKSEKESKNLLNLIKFQKQKEKPVLEEYRGLGSSMSSGFNNFNSFNNFLQSFYSNNNLEVKKSYLLIFKIKDIIMKCYPQLIMANKKGYSIKKLMLKYDLRNLPQLGKKEKIDSLSILDIGKKKRKYSDTSLKRVDEGAEEEMMGGIRKPSIQIQKETDHSLNEEELK
jgi:hypothetical protein